MKMHRNMFTIIFVITVTLSLSSCTNNKVNTADNNRINNEELDICAYNTGIDYDMLMSVSDDYIGQKVRITGKVLQVLQDGNKTTAKIAVDNDPNKIIVGTYTTKLSNIMIFDNDIITICGVYNGIRNYNTVLGNTLSIPSISVDKIELN